MAVETWTDDQIAYLTKLWNDGLPGAEIGRLIGLTKNAVIGKANRLKLSARPSPVKCAVHPRKKRGPDHPIAAPSGPACQWPDGHPGAPSFHFCGDPVVSGKPYCPEHCARAYVKPKPMQARSTIDSTILYRKPIE